MSLTDHIDAAVKIDGSPPSRSATNTLLRNTQSTVGLNVRDFGVLPSNTPVANDTAFSNLRDEILADQGSRLDVVYDITFPPTASGQAYTYTNPRFFQDIYNLRVYGYGAHLRSESLSTRQPYTPSVTIWRNADFVTGSQVTQDVYLLTQDSTSGDVSIFLSLADAALLSVDDWILVFGLDQQNDGFPPNARYFEWQKVTAVDAGTGEVTLYKPLRFEYRTDWRDADAGGEMGKARILRLTRPGFVYPFINEIHGITFDTNTNFDPGFSQFISINGHKVLMKDIDVYDVFPSDTQAFTVDGCKIRRSYEPDKIVDKLVTTNCDDLPNIASGTGINSAVFMNNTITTESQALNLSCAARSVTLIGNVIASRDLNQGFSGCWGGGNDFLSNHHIAGNTFLSTHVNKRAVVSTGGFREVAVKAAGANNEIKIDDTGSDTLNVQRGVGIGSRLIHRDSGSAGTITRMYYDGTDLVLEGTWQEPVVATDVWLFCPTYFTDGGGNWMVGPGGEAMTFATDPFHSNRRGFQKKTVTMGPEYLWSIGGGDVNGNILSAAAHVSECRITVLTALDSASNPRLRLTPNIAGSDLPFTEVELDVVGLRTINAGGVSGPASNDTLLNNFISPAFLYTMNWQVFGVGAQGGVAECIVEFDCLFVD